MPASRIQRPAHLLGATEFSAERETFSAIWLVKTLKQTRWLYDDLERATTLDKNHGRRKEPGSWALAFLAFVASGSTTAVERWWAETSPELWRECGFARRPSYQTTYERFVELETVSDEFARVAAKLIQHCRKHEPLIGAHTHVDSTEAETPAALVHDCRPGDNCPWQQETGKARLARRPKRVSTAVVREERQKEAENAPAADDVLTLGDAEEVRVVDGRVRIRSGKHWYRTLDPDAGVRAYTGPRGARRFWHGYYNAKAIDHYTGAPLAVGVFSASHQEHHFYPELFGRLVTNVGQAPETIVADKGFSVESVFELNTTNGVASVIPWRKGFGRERRQDKVTHDRHGVPRCKHCGGDTRFVRFHVDRSGPRLWFRCVQGVTAACARAQSLYCKTDYRLLLPLWRTDPTYHELRQTHSQYERVHRHWRERYLVAGDNLATRPKRRGIGVQELRAQAALLVEWLRISYREGWLGSARRNRRATALYGFGERAARSLRKARERIGLSLPYGPAAAALGLGDALPPSKRPDAPAAPRRRSTSDPPAPPGDPPDYGDVPF